MLPKYTPESPQSCDLNKLLHQVQSIGDFAIAAERDHTELFLNVYLPEMKEGIRKDKDS